MRLTTEEKIKKVIAEDMCFLITDQPTFEYYSLKSVVSGKVYQIVYKKGIDTYSCECGNILKSFCWHIKAIKTLKGEDYGISDTSEDDEDENTDEQHSDRKLLERDSLGFVI